MKKLVLAALCAAAALALSACKQDPGTATPSASAPASTSPGSGNLGDASEPPPPPTREPTTSGLEYRVSYNWGVPSRQVTVKHPLTAPISPTIPLPYLVAIYAADHPEGSPAYQRISFYFRGAFPSYNLQYVREVLSEGPGTPIALPGNAFLRVGFVDAQQHDETGANSLRTSPRNPLGFRNLKGYGLAGDFEGHVTYGLGIQVAPNSDQVLKIRAGELKKPDGAGGFFYVVHFDVETG